MADRVNKLADVLYRLRVQKRIQSKDVALAIGLEPPMYSRIERGERRVKQELLDKIAEFYEIDVEELCTLWFADKVHEATCGFPPEIVRKAISIVNKDFNA